MISASLGLPCSINISFQASRFSCNQSFHLSGLLFLISGHQIFSESLSNHTIPNVGHIRLILPDQLKMKKLSSLCTPTQVSRGFAFAHLRTILAAEGLKQSLGWANNSRVLEVWPPYPTQSRARTSERGTDRILRSQSKTHRSGEDAICSTCYVGARGGVYLQTGQVRSIGGWYNDLFLSFSSRCLSTLTQECLL